MGSMNRRSGSIERACGQPLSPKLSRRLCVIDRQDRRLDLGLRKTLAALKSLSVPERPISEQD
jgi:hypothetical protein